MGRQLDPTNGISLTHASTPAPARTRRATEGQRRGLELAVRRSVALRKAGELDCRHGAELVASLGPNEGHLTWASSPHVMWLLERLEARR